MKTQERGIWSEFAEEELENNMDLDINGMHDTESVIEMIKDNIDEGNYEDAKDYLNQFKDYLFNEKEVM
jgi:hypothetical protein